MNTDKTIYNNMLMLLHELRVSKLRKNDEKSEKPETIVFFGSEMTYTLFQEPDSEILHILEQF